MKRTGFLSFLTAAVLAIAAMVTGSSNASAQFTACAAGTYTVDLTNVPAGCFQAGIPIKTSWGGGTWIFSANYTAPAVYTVNPGAPPGTALDGVKVGSVTFVPGAPLQRTVLLNGCALCFIICNDASGCLVIKGYPGPCPANPLPCP